MCLPQPILGFLGLPTVLEGLAEQAVIVADAVAVGGQSDGRHRIEEAGGQAAEPPVAERRVGLVGKQGGIVDVELRDQRADGLVQAQVGDGVFEQAADQELHRQVVDALVALGTDALGGFEPGGDDEVANGA